MLAILKNRTYRHLFAAQVIALLGTGLMTVALGLLAYDLAGADAGAVLGTALAIKMIAYVGVAPVAQAFTDGADAIVVGDGANDLGMIQLAGTGVALHAKPVVAAQAGVRIDHGDLTALLYLQGYGRDEFVIE